MSEEKSKAFRESYIRCMRHPDFTLKFYETLVDGHEELRSLFERVEMGSLSAMLSRTLQMVVLAYAHNGDDLRAHLRSLGGHHARLGVVPDHYGVWIETLVETAAEHDPYFTEETRTLWRDALERIGDVMVGETAGSR